MQLKTVTCIGTGPSLTQQQVDTARNKGYDLYGCNRTYQIVPDLSLFYSVNLSFWTHYWSRGLKEYPAEKWTTNKEAADTFGLNWIAETNKPGLSADSDLIHHGHRSGYSLVSMAHRSGADRIILLGYDCRYAEDYDGRERDAGSTPRHYFGEYPESMQHWPSVCVQGGVHTELVGLYRSIKEQGLIEVINCTPGSAIDCFERIPIDDA